MTLYPTLEAAREASKRSKVQIVTLLEIEHKISGVQFIGVTCTLSTLKLALKRKPIPEIVRILSEHSPKTDEELAEEKAVRDNMVSIHLSSRGWGDYSPCECTADLRKSDAEILSECKKTLMNGHDVDKRDQTDKEILALIQSARKKLEASREPRRSVKVSHGVGYCYSCRSHCYGDCGDYQPSPTIKTEMRDISLENLGAID